MIKLCAQCVRMPECCDTLIYSSLTVPKGDCNIKYDCPRLLLGTGGAARTGRTESSQSWLGSVLTPGSALPAVEVECFLGKKRAFPMSGAQVARGAGRAITAR